jgi:8-oxo-dGTP pyrophosphatase MutT (NUDIX family)
VRELREELGWTVEVGMFELAVWLVNEGAPIVRRACTIPRGGTVAWFYRARDLAISEWPVQTEEGYAAEWREWDAALQSELGLWHRLPLKVEREGGKVAMLRE